MTILNIQPKIKMLTTFVCANEESFMKKFAPNFKNCDLIGLWFGENSVKTHYVDMISGQHITDEILIKDFAKWCEQVNYS